LVRRSTWTPINNFHQPSAAFAGTSAVIRAFLHGPPVEPKRVALVQLAEKKNYQRREYFAVNFGTAH
jgi:hypothetical protein